MRRMTRLTAFLGIVFLFPALKAVSEEGWKVSFDMEREKVLPGEPITALVRFINESDEALPRILWSLFLDGANEQCLDRIRLLADHSVPPGVEVSGDGVELFEPSTVLDSEVHISRICNLQVSDAERLYGLHRVCLHDHGVEMACTSFEYIRPEAHDVEALAALPSKLRDMITDRTMVPDDFLEKYPSSTYAGYVLAQKKPVLRRPFGRSPEEAVQTLIEPGYFQSLFSTTYDHDPPDPWVRLEIAARESAATIKAYIEMHPDFLKRERLEIELAIISIATGEYQQACSSFTWIAKNGEKDREYAQNIIESMKKRKMCTIPVNTDEP